MMARASQITGVYKFNNRNNPTANCLVNKATMPTINLEIKSGMLPYGLLEERMASGIGYQMVEEGVESLDCAFIHQW